MKKIISIMLAVCVLLALCACSFKIGPWELKLFGGDDDEQPAAQTMFEELSDYAKRLEEAGNEEAAAAVYEIIIRNGGKDLANAAREKIDLIRTLDEIDEISEIFGEGGDVK